eukprot:gi/632987735/ref/XP_007882721.1/ PREDICTED: probable G-protein coupled receptor 146 [Callorhinchus milii]
MWSCIQGDFGPNGTSCDDLCHRVGLSLSAASVTYLIVCLPLGLAVNALILVVNLRHKASLDMPDIYFTNMALAGLLLNLVALVQLPSPDYLLWPAWTFGREVCMASFILFNMASLVSIYSSTLLSLDCFIWQAVPHTHLASAYNTRHVCSFVWGGSALASFSSLLFFVCSKVSDRADDCSKLQTQELGDAIMVFTGFLVPVAGVAYALRLLLCSGKESHPAVQSSSAEADSNISSALHRLLLATVSVQFALWLPYYVALLVSTARVVSEPGEAPRSAGLLHFIRGWGELIAYLSSCVVPLLYRRLHKSFEVRARRLVHELRCAVRTCGRHRPAQRQHVSTVSWAETGLSPNAVEVNDN